MTNGTKIKTIMAFCSVMLIGAFFLFVSLFQSATLAKAMIQIHDHAHIIASSLWTFEKSSPTAYLTLAAKANDYQRIVVTDDKERAFLDISGPPLTKLDAFFLNANLISIHQIESDVVFEENIIGKISAAWPSRTIYTNLYILFCIILFLIGFWLFLKLIDSNRMLERRVRERTAALEKENNERKRVEAELRKTERIVSTSQDLMALISRDCVYESVNESYLTAHNLSREAVVGRKISGVWGIDVFRKKIEPRLAQAFSGQTIRYQEEFVFAGIGRKIMDVSYFPIFDKVGNVEGVVLNSRDITETRRMEEHLMQSQKIESIGTLAGGVAHEINNPLNGIMNYAQLILDGMDKENPLAEYAREILHETLRIAGIVRNLLTFSRNEKQSHSPAELPDIISSVLSLIQTVMRHDQIILEVAIPGDLPRIKCRSQQIQQVLMNLLTNARDALNGRYPGFSPEKKLRITAGMIQKEDRKFIRTMVEDLGIGISPEIRDRIFDPFFTTKPKETGTGLGLSISYGIIRDHGGELSMESEPGRFTRFYMDISVDNGWALPEKGVPPAAGDGGDTTYERKP
ncbi:MAG: ATP-binding protein [Pseudomonadota bacterium]